MRPSVCRNPITSLYISGGVGELEKSGHGWYPLCARCDGPLLSAPTAAVTTERRDFLLRTFAGVAFTCDSCGARLPLPQTARWVRLQGAVPGGRGASERRSPGARMAPVDHSAG